MSEQSETPDAPAPVTSSSAPVASSSAPKGRGGQRRGAGGGSARRPGSGRLVPLEQLPSPDELVLFNALLAAEAEKEKAERKLRKLEQAKDQAAARVKALNDDPNASKEDKAAAEATYKEALAKLQAGPDGDASTDEPATDGDASTDEPATDEPATDGDASTDEPATDGDAPTDEPATDESAATADEPPVDS